MWFLNSGAGVAVFEVGWYVCFSKYWKLKFIILRHSGISHAVAGRIHRWWKLLWTIALNTMVVFMSNVAALLHCCSYELACWYQKYQTQSKNCRAFGIHLIYYVFLLCNCSEATVAQCPLFRWCGEREVVLFWTVTVFTLNSTHKPVHPTRSNKCSRAHHGTHLA